MAQNVTTYDNDNNIIVWKYPEIEWAASIYEFMNFQSPELFKQKIDNYIIIYILPCTVSSTHIA